MPYSDGEREVSLTEAIGLSRAYLGVVTHNYVEDIRLKRDPRIKKELDTAKEFNLHCVLLLFDDLTEDDKKVVEEIFKDHRVIKKYENVPKNPLMFKKWIRKHMNEIAKHVNELK